MTSSDSPAERLVADIAAAVRDAGGRAWIAGGSIRDRRLGLEPKDFDLEVYRVEPAKLLELLRGVGRVDDVGRMYGILKVTRDGATIDVGLPRKETKIARGHRGFDVEADPWLPERDACARRDLTINALLEDPLTGEIVDFFGGLDDLKHGVLRHVSPAFAEDPLRVLRVVQFAARFGFALAPETAALCRSLDLSELPRERILEEVSKWLLRARRPSLGLAAWIESGAAAAFPEAGVRDDAALAQRLDAAAAARADSRFPLEVMLAALLLNAGPADARRFLERLLATPARIERVLRLIERARDVSGWRARGDAADAELRRASLAVELDALSALAKAIDRDDGEWLARRASDLGILLAAPAPLLQGRDLIALGAKPGKALGDALAAAFEAQLDGRIATRDEALAWAREHLR